MGTVVTACVCAVLSVHVRPAPETMYEPSTTPEPPMPMLAAMVPVTPETVSVLPEMEPVKETVGAETTGNVARPPFSAMPGMMRPNATLETWSVPLAGMAPVKLMEPEPPRQKEPAVQVEQALAESEVDREAKEPGAQYIVAGHTEPTGQNAPAGHAIC
jgi:hypothetical protein